MQRRSLALLVPLLAVFPAGAQEGSPNPTNSNPAIATAPYDGLARASAEARALWDTLLSATRSTNPDPIRAFRIQAEILTRQETQTNDLRIAYSYLEPNSIRFSLTSGRELGRSGPTQRDHWLKDGDEVVRLSGSDYIEDRRQIKEMLAVAKNFVALSDPAKLRITSLSRSNAPPAELAGRLLRLAERLRWLSVESPDFALLTDDVKLPQRTAGVLDDAPAEPSFRVDLGIEKSGEPVLAIVRPAGASGRAPEPDQRAPMAIRLDRYTALEAGYRVPFQLHVHPLEWQADAPRFGDKPSQEIYITRAELALALKPEDFEP